MSKKIVLVTGSSAGLGFECCLQLARLSKTHVILTGRSQSRTSVVDLTSLAPVRDFTRKLSDRKLPISSVVCNTCVQVKVKEVTVDGFKTTFGVNHLAHFLLAELLREHTHRIVMLTSCTYDPAEKSGVPALNASNLDQLVRGYDKFDPMEAYSTSELLNFLFTKEFTRRYPDGPRVIAYSPRFTPETSLFREQHWLVWMAQKPIYKFFTCLGGGCITAPEYSGGYMAKLAAKEPLTPDYATGAYVRVGESWEVNAQATDRMLGKELWEKSEVWAGLK